MANPTDKTAQLAQDTQPLPPEKLTEEEWSLLGRIADEFALVQKEVGQGQREEKRDLSRKATVQEPWSIPEPRRSSRVMMLDGPRGSGKSSLILTLIQAWKGRLEVPNAGETALAVAEKLRQQGPGIRVLPTLDFDPQPQHLHPYAWLVMALQPVVRYLDDDLRPKKPRTQGLCEDDGDLWTAWERLYRQALIAWDGIVFQKLVQSDLDQLVYDHSKGQEGWLTLQSKWTGFLDRLLSELEEARRLPKDGLLVYHIDDIDLQPGKVKDVLLAVRLARHPRVVFVLGGHMDHLREVLARELADAKAFAQAVNPKADLLATDILKKVIPERNRFNMPLLGFVDALKLFAGSEELTDWLNGERDSWGQLPTISRAVLAAIGPASGHPLAEDDIEFREEPSSEDMADEAEAGEGVLFRDFQQVVDLVFRDAAQRPSTVIRSLLTRARARDGLTLIREGRSGILAPAGAAEVMLNARWAGGKGMAETQRIEFYATYENPQKPLRLGSTSELWLDSKAAPFTLDYGPNLPVAGNTAILGRCSLLFWWPGVQVARPMEARAVLRWWQAHPWRRAAPGLRAAAWLDLTARMQDSPVDLGAPLARELRASDDAHREWNVALSRLPRLPTDTRTERGLQPYRIVLGAALLAAPEFGLPEDCQLELLERARDCAGNAWPAMCDDLDRERRASLEHAASHKQTAVQGAVFDADGLELDIRTEWPNAPWFQKAELAPLGTNWLEWSLDEEGTRLFFIDGSMAHHTGSTWTLGTLFRRSSGRREPTWPVREIGEQLAKVQHGIRATPSKGDLRGWRTILRDVQVRLGSVGPQVALSELWRRTADLRRQPEARSWFGLNESADQLVYTGPGLRLVRSEGEDDQRWTVLKSNGETVDPVVGALTFICQSVVATVSGQRPKGIEIHAGLDDIYPHFFRYPKAEIAAWVDHYNAVARWHAVVARAATLMEADAKMSPAVERWRAASWLAIILDAGRMERANSLPAEPFQFPISPNTGFPPIPPALGDWANSVAVDGLLDPHMIVAWDDALAKLEILSAEMPFIWLYNVKFKPNEAAFALDFLKKSSQSRISQVLKYGPAAKSIADKRPVSSIAELQGRRYVGPVVVANLFAWARSRLAGPSGDHLA